MIVADVPACYLALGALHGLYKPIPGKFKDYIAIPKANGYQSIHTDLIGPYGVPVEVQIRTEQMHLPRRVRRRLALDVQGRRRQALRAAEADPPLAAVLLEIQHQSGDPQEFLEHVKVDLFPTRSTCSLRAGSSRCRAARPRSTSLMRCTPTSATAAWRRR